ncbi:MAG: twin-arginine translocation pathway signal [Mycobacterium sp.]|uniref:twin-arginine translocation pathway signal n=1 Tax=Mycobacterium sp. TaxID=1785 RepID=UPI002612A04B|nr:twin-arginine translocation pathway signal [Mycobacterium sp.]MDI3315381.1 twin-arginine translocation pathway signal [Mycobacterium sp.]
MRGTGPRRWCRRCLAGWRVILVAALTVGAMAVTVGLFFFQFRPDQQLGDAAGRRAIKAASDGAVALLSYSPENLERDFAAAKSHLTGGFLAYYNKFSEQVVAPAAREKRIATTARVVRAAVSELHPDSAVVLVFVDQTTTSKENPTPVVTASSVRVALTKVRGLWLISRFDPVG